MFLESPISTSNLPKSWKMYLHQYRRNRLSVLGKWPTGIGKSPTSIGKIAYWYWQNRLLVLAKSPTSIDEFDIAYI